nr:MAG TPA: hypothetical protein [Bacteriophage sp.]
MTLRLTKRSTAHKLKRCLDAEAPFLFCAV